MHPFPTKSVKTQRWQTFWRAMAFSNLPIYIVYGPKKASFAEQVAALEEIVDVLRNVGGDKWKLQARSLVRAFIGRERDEHEGDEGWDRVEALAEELKGGGRVEE